MVVALLLVDASQGQHPLVAEPRVRGSFSREVPREHVELLHLPLLCPLLSPHLRQLHLLLRLVCESKQGERGEREGEGGKGGG